MRNSALRIKVESILNKYDPCHVCPLENEIDDEYTGEASIFCYYIYNKLPFKYAMDCMMRRMHGKGWRYEDWCNNTNLEKDLLDVIKNS